MYIANKAIAFWQRLKLCFYRDSKDAIFRYKIAVVAIMKNEGDYIKEWLDFHLKVGVEHFFIYNNDSTFFSHRCIRRIWFCHSDQYYDKGHRRLETIWNSTTCIARYPWWFYW